MRGSSLASLKAVRTRFEPVLVAAGESAAALGTELFAVVDVLDAEASLRRALTDPARTGDDKARLVASLFGERVDARVVTVVDDAAAARWSREADLGDALETLAVEAILADADNRGVLVRVTDELFGASRTLLQQPRVREALADHRSTREAREALLNAVFGQVVDADTLLLVKRAGGKQRDGHVVPVLQRYNELGAARRKRAVAHVTSGVALSDEQVARLGAALQKTYGRELQVEAAVEPGLVGGLRIQVGADVMDATVLSRLDDVRRKIAS